jgi:hypothetical protein
MQYDRAIRCGSNAQENVSEQLSLRNWREEVQMFALANGSARFSEKAWHSKPFRPTYHAGDLSTECELSELKHSALSAKNA